MQIDIHALVLAGGMGSRSENPELPKILQPIGENVDLLFLTFQAISRSKISDVTLLLGHLNEQVIQRAKELQSSFPELNINWIIDQEIKGTHSAVANAMKATQASKFILILGDLAISGDFEYAIRAWSKSRKKIAVLCHPNLHPHDSDLFLINESHQAEKFVPKNTENVALELPNVALGGVLLFEREAFELSELASDDIVKNMVGKTPKDIEIINSTIYYKDSGTPSRLKQIREDFEQGYFQRRGLAIRGAIFIDRDGTLVPDIGTSRSTIKETDFEVETIKALRDVNRIGIPVFLVSNQPGVSKGQITYFELLKTQAEMQQVLLDNGALLDDYRFCPHHPHTGFEDEIVSLKGPCVCRKPNAGMLFDLAEIHGIDLSLSFMIGDSEADQGAALRSGANFILGIYGSQTHSVERALLQAAEMITR